MADLSQHANYTGAYSGLLNNLWLTLAIAGVCFTGYEIEVRVPRRRGWQGGKKRVWVRIWGAGKRGWRRLRDRRGKEAEKGESGQETEGDKEKRIDDPEERERTRVGDREKWEFGYIYQPKTWQLNPGPPVSKWPLMWVRDVLKIKEADMPPIWGLDITLHLRFLRGCLFYTLLQLLIVAPILLPLHILYSPDDVDPTSMVRAGISSLVESSGSRWLWVHSVLVWWVTICWVGTVLWIIWGGIGYRRREVARLRRRIEGEKQKRQKTERREGSGEEEEGEIRGVLVGDMPGAESRENGEMYVDGEEPVGVKQYRTLMVLNIPPDMRDEGTLEDYFNHYLHIHHRRISARRRVNQPYDRTSLANYAGPGITSIFKKAPIPLINTTPRTSVDVARAQSGKERASSSDGSAEEGDGEMGDDLESEVEEIILVRKLGSLISLRERRGKVLKELEMAHVKLARRVLKAVSAHKSAYPLSDWTRTSIVMLSALDRNKEEVDYAKLSKKERLDRLTAALAGFVGDEDEQRGEGSRTVWEVLHSLPRPLLDPYQDLTHLRLTSRFRKSNAPLIDYLTTKLAYLTILLDDARSKPMSSFPASSAAFVTFRDARTARLALKVLDNHPKRRLACKTQAAPNWAELLWPRLGLSVYRSEFVRGWVVFVGVWAFTLAWIFPVSLFCALTSLTYISGFIPALADWVRANPETATAVTALVPVILVALLTISICPILLVIANKAETIVTRLGIHNSVLERFWKFLMVNGVVFFAIGQSAISAYLNAFQRSNFDPLPIVASAFPTAAPYFASYILLQVAIQPCFEIFRFGLPAIVYWFGTRWSSIPRQRLSRTEHPTFSHFSQLPYQLLAGAIMHLFMLLNPLVIPFTLVYYATCYLVWKRQFTYVYGRLYENNGRRSCIRILRYSLDALALGQFVLFAFFILNRAKGEAISTGILFFITMVIKLVTTRAVKQRFDNLEIEEADILCPPVARDSASEQTLAEEFEDAKPHAGHPHTSLRMQSKAQVMMERLHIWIHKYAYDSAVLPPGYRKPIPFDWLVFNWLDKYFTYAIGDELSVPADGINAPLPSTSAALELDRMPTKAKALISPHHKLVPWEDIPPYWRSRGYDDQPAYTETYDDFIWLPRDPLSTLDLDDTIEMRASLTTSAGGDGHFGGFDDEDEEEQVEVVAEGWKEIVERSAASGAAGPASEHEQDEPEMSPAANSARRLLGMMDNLISPSPESHHADTDLPSHIGSEVEVTPLQSVRRGTIKFADGVQSIFRRPRADTSRSSQSEAHTMRTLSHASTPSVVIPVSDSPELILSDVDRRVMDESFLTPHRPTRQSSRVPSTAEEEEDLEDTPSTVVPAPESPETFISPPRSAPAGSGSRITFSSQSQADLGRSPSGRRPVLSHRGSQSSGMPGGLSRLISPVPASVTTPSIRSASAFSHQIRDRSSSSLSAAQQALLREVMEEERIASQSAREAERAGIETEREEVRKERERAGQALPPATPTTADSIRRRPSVSNSTASGSAVNVEGGHVRRTATTARSGLGNAGMVALAANRFAAGRRRGHSVVSVPSERARSGSAGEFGVIEAGPGPSTSLPKTVIQAQLDQPRITGMVSGDTSGSLRTGPAGGVGGLAGLGT